MRKRGILLNVLTFAVILSFLFAASPAASLSLEQGKSFNPSTGKGTPPPKKPGGYCVERDGKCVYAGESDDLSRRYKEHEKGKKLKPRDSFKYDTCERGAPGCSTEEHRKWERQEIKKHNPPENKSSGGEGRKPKEEKKS